MDVDYFTLRAKVYCKSLAGGPPARKNLNIVLNSSSPSVEELRQQVNILVEESTSQNIEFIYCGRQLSDGKRLAEFGIQNGSCVNAIVRPAVVAKPVDPQVTREQVTQALTKLMEPGYRSTVETIFTTTSVIDDIIASSSELQKDLVAQVILKDLNIIHVLADSDSVNSVLERHPSLAAATIKVCDAVMERVKKHGVVPSSSTGATYALDQMSDDEEPAAPRAQSSNQITASQLAEALAMAASNARPSTAARNPTTQSNTASTSVLSAALSQALGTVSSNSNTVEQTERPQESSTSNMNFDSQLQQLRDMGITDERVALEALRAAGGNVHIALDIIYGGDNI